LRASFDRGRNSETRQVLLDRVVPGTRKLLQIFMHYDLSVTFFVLAEIAENFPMLIDEIINGGHEIASHGTNHQSLKDLSKSELREELRTARSSIKPWTKDSASSPGYRSPDFSFPANDDEAWKILGEEGFGWSSCVSMARRDSGWKYSSEYQINESHNGSILVGACDTNDSKGILEYPVQGFRILGVPLGWGGGFWLRVLPLKWNLSNMRKYNLQGKPFHVYLHPWEFDIDQPRIKLPSWRAFRQYFGMKSLEHKLAAVLDEFEFGLFNQ
jgi:polysaccharide deacetylase family protein (PEP-CTERM system associated)